VFLWLVRIVFSSVFVNMSSSVDVVYVVMLELSVMLILSVSLVMISVFYMYVRV